MPAPIEIASRNLFRFMVSTTMYIVSVSALRLTVVYVTMYSSVCVGLLEYITPLQVGLTWPNSLHTVIIKPH